MLLVFWVRYLGPLSRFGVLAPAVWAEAIFRPSVATALDVKFAIILGTFLVAAIFPLDWRVILGIVILGIALTSPLPSL